MGEKYVVTELQEKHAAYIKINAFLVRTFTYSSDHTVILKMRTSFLMEFMNKVNLRKKLLISSILINNASDETLSY